MTLKAVQKGGRVSARGIYGGMADKFSWCALMKKGLQIRTGQNKVQTSQFLHHILEGEVDSTLLNLQRGTSGI